MITIGLGARVPIISINAGNEQPLIIDIQHRRIDDQEARVDTQQARLTLLERDLTDIRDLLVDQQPPASLNAQVAD